MNCCEHFSIGTFPYPTSRKTLSRLWTPLERLYGVFTFCSAVCSCFVSRLERVTVLRGVPYFVTLYRGVVFVHHSCKKGTLLQNYHISRPFLRSIEAVSVEKHNKNNNLVGGATPKTPKCSDQRGAGEGHTGVWGNVYMYKHTEVKFKRTTIGCIRMYIHHIMLQTVT
jgi:hypothetical protein